MDYLAYGLLAIVLILGFIFSDEKRAGRVSSFLRGLFRAKAPVPPALVPVAIPEEPKIPELIYGNIPAVPDEQGAEPDHSEIFVFPEKGPPLLRYADFNTRLFVVASSNEGIRRIYPERVCDDPVYLRGNQAFVNNLCRRQLRPAYPTILDPGGMFALASLQLQREPFASSPVIDAYLEIPRDRRPAVVSIMSGPASGAGEKKETPQYLVFCRYGFRDFALQLDFLNPNWTTSLKHLFAAFLGSDLDWSNFSHARLRYLSTIEDREMAQTASVLADAIDAAERHRHDEEELALDKMESFSAVFRRTALPAAIPEAQEPAQ